MHHVSLPVPAPDPLSTSMLPALVKIMNDPPTVVKLTSSLDTWVTAVTVGIDHAAPPPPPEPLPKVHHVAHWWQDLVYNIPTPKVDKCCQYLFPSEAMVDFATYDRAPSPTTPFEVPVNWWQDNIMPTMRNSVTRVTGRPRVCGLVADASSRIQVMLLAAHQSISSMVDGGADSCLTNILSLLVDFVDIPLLPTSVVVKGSNVKMDHCCTKRGLLLLLLADGNVYYQTCFYCENAVETIISPQAILDGSDIFVDWQQTGYKYNSPGLLQNSSASGLASMSIVLEKRDGLYYTHTDVYAVDKAPVCPMYPNV